MIDRSRVLQDFLLEYDSVKHKEKIKEVEEKI